MRSDDKSDIVAGLLGCGIPTGILLGIWFVFARWTDRNLEFWLSYTKGEVVEVDWWLSALLCIAGPFNLLGNLIAEIAKLAI